jgi:flagellar hook protein FlgE
MKNKTWLLILVLSLTAFNVIAQENLPTDPLLNFKKFYEIGLSVNGTRVNTNHTEFNTSNGQFKFEKNNYLPNIDGSFNYGWLFKDKENSSVWSLKTGINIVNRNANLTDSVNSNLRLYTGYLQLPILFGFRSPLRYNTVKNNFYRAFEINAGVYAATPLMQKLDNPDNLDASGENLPSNYIKIGIIGEIVFTALDSKGHGHKFGIRASNDFPTILKLKETPNELYPYYYTIGLFYNITNIYK